MCGGGWATEELLDRWRTPGEDRSQVWEERFGESRYVPLGQSAWDDALKSAGLVADQVDHIAIAGTRSEEHTSELQSLMRSSYAVVCLKKKITYILLNININRTLHRRP